jgi:hypothetical protein
MRGLVFNISSRAVDNIPSVVCVCVGERSATAELDVDPDDLEQVLGHVAWAFPLSSRFCISHFGSMLAVHVPHCKLLVLSTPYDSLRVAPAGARLPFHYPPFCPHSPTAVTVGA